MRTSLDDADRVGNEQRAELVFPLIRKDDRHGHRLIDFGDGIVGVGQAEGQLPVADHQGHLLVAGHDVDVILLHVEEELLGRLRSPFGKQASGLRRCRAGQRPGHARPSSPTTVDQVANRARQLIVLRQFGIHDQHPRPRCQRMPGATRRAVHGRQLFVAGGEDTPPVNRGLLQSQRVQNLVVPEYVAARSRRFLDDRGGQADRLRGLGIELGQDRDAGDALEFLVDRLGEFSVERSIGDDLGQRWARRTTQAQLHQRQQTNSARDPQHRQALSVP